MDELEANIGLRDKNLSEFIIHLCKTSSSFDEFSSKLQTNGADFPQIFSRNLYDKITASSTKFPGLTISSRARSRSPSRLTEGKTYECKVINLMSFGFLVECPLFTGLVKEDRPDVSRGQAVEVRLIKSNCSPVECELVRIERPPEMPQAGP